MNDEVLKELGWHGLVLSNRREALFLINEADLESQLLAIKGVLRRNEKAESRRVYRRLRILRWSAPGMVDTAES